MSDESQPPPLRLKPRVQAAPAEPSAGEAPPPAAPPESSPSAPAAPDAGAPRFRLKPKLSTDSAAEPEATPPPSPPEPVSAEKPDVPSPAAAPAETSAPPPESARPRLKPRLSTEAAAEPPPIAQPASQVSVPPPAPAPLPAIAPSAEPMIVPSAPAASPEAASESGRFKLKPKTAAATPPPGPVAVPPPPSPEPPALAAEPPTVSPPPAAPTPAPVSGGSVPHLNLPPRASVDVTEEIAALASRRPEEKPAFRIGLLAVIVLVAVAVAGGGYFAYKTYLTDASAMDTPTPTKPASPLAKNVSNVVKQAENKAKEFSSVPGQLIGKAQDAMAARRGNEQDRIDSALEGRESEGKRAIAARTPDEIAERLAQANNTPAPRPEVVHLDLGTSSSPPSSAPTPALDVASATVQASPAFKAFVTSARISGVFQGNPPRALINGRTVRPGDLLDGALGVVFERVDAERKLVFFKDQTGAIVAKKY